MLENSSSHQLTLEEVTVWRGDHCICEDLTVEVSGGQLLELTGPNGAGKTSLIRTIVGLVSPEEGTVKLDGLRTDGNRLKVGGEMRYVAHNNGITLELTPWENLRLAGRLLDRVSLSEPQEALERTGVSHLSQRLCATLSSGQRRRVALARLLLGQALLWVLDEPLISLDRDGVKLVESLLRAHLEAGGIAVLATHQPIPLAQERVCQVALPRLKEDA